MPRKNHLIVESGCTQDNERWALSACGLNEETEKQWDGTRAALGNCGGCVARPEGGGMILAPLYMTYLIYKGPWR